MDQLKIIYVPTGHLRPNPWNSNVVSPEMEGRLRNSLKQLNFYKPIIVRELDDGTFQILGGEHRWRAAKDLGHEQVPVICLGKIDDKQAKLIGLADNGGYGIDDVTRLNSVLQDIGMEDVAAMLPYTEDELAGMFKAVDEIDLSKIGFDADVDPLDDVTPAPAERPVKLTELMRFKVPVQDREAVEKLIKKLIVARGFDKEEDSLVAAGMALVEVANAAKSNLGLE
ncbi:ParB/RepB/Spo0J family partition protein [Comamonas thiooxydans]|uniref:ParB/RepB/Spo0J family partition protein n=1 Tax=Comamonas thiooxydans TaxID=363952 RepID=UPI0018D2E151|nr:ParB/RepB/Spo0J family partition protein [Comamonas thiooxydans]